MKVHENGAKISVRLNGTVIKFEQPMNLSNIFVHTQLEDLFLFAFLNKKPQQFLNGDIYINA